MKNKEVAVKTHIQKIHLNRQEEMLDSVDCSNPDIYLPDDSSKSLTDSWSLKSYPTSFVNEDNTPSSWSSNLRRHISERSQGRYCSRVIDTTLIGSSDISCTQLNQNEVVKNNLTRQESYMPAPSWRKRKRYPNPGKISRKRKMK